MDSFLIYQRLFEYSGSIQDILELPYSIFNDIISKQIKFKKKEKDELENLKNNPKGSGNNKSPFKRRR